MYSMNSLLNIKPILNDQIFNSNYKFVTDNPVYKNIRQMWKNDIFVLEGQYREKVTSNIFIDYNNNFNSSSQGFLNLETFKHLLQKSNNEKFESTNFNEFQIYVGTWNVGGLYFVENLDLINWLYPDKTSLTPDIYIVGFQEIVNLNPKNIMFLSNSDRVELWKKIVYNNICKIGK